MSDDEIKPEGYPAHDTEWRRTREKCRRDVRDALAGHGSAAQAAVLSELLSEMVEGQAESQFAREWEIENDE